MKPKQGEQMKLSNNSLKLTVSVFIALNLAACTFFKKESEVIEVPSPQVQKPQKPHRPELNPQPNTQTQPESQGLLAPKQEAEDLGYTATKLPATSGARLKTQELAVTARTKYDTEGYRPSLAKKLYIGALRAQSSPSSFMAADSGGGKMLVAAHEYQNFSSEEYDQINENKFIRCEQKPVSTFSIDVDTASYANVRRFITGGSRPPVDAVRIEELINYFPYTYSSPEKGAFSTHLEMGPSLWNAKNRVVRIGIKGKEIKATKRPASNLVFLIDVSGSMQSPQKLPLVKQSLRLLVEELSENDQISIVVYAGAVGLALPPTTGDKKSKILSAIDKLEAGGSTNGSGGITLAYQTAEEEFVKGGVNRVILATDGDFNVGITDRNELVRMIEKQAKKNIYLSVLGFGMGNYKDGMMETISNKGNGNYAYIDSQKEAQKVMVEQINGTLVTIAKDVKIQVEFNPNHVAAYRLIGYENRLLKNEDFDDDTKDAGDIGAGHTVTALYEIVPAGQAIDTNSEEGLKYKQVKPATDKAQVAKAQVKVDEPNSNEMLTVKIRYKRPDADISEKQEFVLTKSEKSFEEASNDFRFASSVALFGMLLRNSEHVKSGSFETVVNIAKKALGEDEKFYRKDFLEMVRSLDSIKINHQANLED